MTLDQVSQLLAGGQTTATKKADDADQTRRS